GRSAGSWGPTDDAALRALMAIDRPGSPGTSLDALKAELRGRNAPSQLRYVFEGIKALEGLPSGIDLAGLERYVRLWTARMRGLRGYAPGAYAGRVVLCRAEGEEAPKAGAAGLPALEHGTGWE